MTTKAGVWIDPQKAVVVVVTNARTEIKRFAADTEKPTRRAARSSSQHKYKPTDFIAEDKRERKVAIDRKEFYNEVIAGIRGANLLLIMGPGEAKGELGKQIKTKKLKVAIAALETSDRMTERQLVATVVSHFASAPARKSAAPKKKTARKSTSGGREKKSGK